MTDYDPDYIDHYREAENTMDAVSFAHGSNESSSYTDYALVQATLALAYEQRTASLIAYQSNVERSYFQTLAKPRSGRADDLNRQIIERLGLA